MKTYDTFELIQSEDADEITLMLVTRQYDDKQQGIPGATARFVRRLDKFVGGWSPETEADAMKWLGREVGEFIMRRFRG